MMMISVFHIHFKISYRLLWSVGLEEVKKVMPGSLGMVLLYQASKLPKILDGDRALMQYLDSLRAGNRWHPLKICNWL